MFNNSAHIVWSQHLCEQCGAERAVPWEFQCHRCISRSDILGNFLTQDEVPVLQPGFSFFATYCSASCRNSHWRTHRHECLTSGQFLDRVQKNRHCNMTNGQVVLSLESDHDEVKAFTQWVDAESRVWAGQEERKDEDVAQDVAFYDDMPALEPNLPIASVPCLPSLPSLPPPVRADTWVPMDIPPAPILGSFHNPIDLTGPPSMDLYGVVPNHQLRCFRFYAQLERQQQLKRHTNEISNITGWYGVDNSTRNLAEVLSDNIEWFDEHCRAYMADVRTTDEEDMVDDAADDDQEESAEY